MTPNMQALARQIELEMQRQALLSLVVLAVFVAVMFWLLYITIKAAIRDGIKESGLVRTWANTARDAITASPREGQPNQPDSHRNSSHSL